MAIPTAALQSVETLALHLLEDLPAAITATDLEGTLIYANRAAEALYGYSRDELLGRSARGLLLPGGGPVEAEIRKLTLRGESWAGEVLVQSKDGRRLITNAHVGALSDADGAVLGFLSVAEDVSERYFAEQRLAVQYAVTQVIAGRHPLGHVAYRVLEAVCPALDWQLGAFWLRHQDDSGPDASYHCEQLWAQRGIDGSLFAGQSAGLQLTDQETLVGAAAVSGEVQQATAEERERFGRPLDEHVARGFAFPVTAAGRVEAVLEFYTASDAPLELHTVALVTSVASQLGQFIEHQQAEQLLARSERRKSAILAAALDCIITIDSDGKIIEINRAAEQTFGFRQQDVAGRDLADLIVPERMRELHRQGLERLRAGAAPTMLNKRLEMSALRADGSEFPVEIAITRVDDEEGRPLYTAFLRDISEQRQAGDERKRLLGLERAARVDAEAAQARLVFLAESSDLLSSSLNYEETLATLAQLLVPRLADWCSVDLVGANGEIERLAVVHSDPEKVALAKELQKRYPPDPDAETGVPYVIRTGESELIPEIPDELLREALKDEPELYEIMAGLGLVSAITIPLVGRGRVLGAITLVSDNPDRHYSSDDLALAEAIGERAGLAVDNVRLFNEQREVAHRLQRALLPESLPRIAGLEVAASYRPGFDGLEIGGDFYDLFAVDDAYVAVVGDVCGKGIEAATMTGLARHTIRAAARLESSPARLLELLNRVIYDASGESKFATVACVKLQPLSGGAFRATIACGGHPSPLLRANDGSVQRISARGMALGMFEQAELKEDVFTIEPGETLSLYTDGVIEARSSGSFFGKERLVELVGEHGGCTAAELVELIETEAVAFAADTTRDDIAILCFRACSDDDPAYSSLTLLGEREGAINSVHLGLQLQASLRSIALARQALVRLQPRISAELYEKSRLLMSEVVSNAVKHSTPGSDATVGVSIDLRRDLLSIAVTDPGAGFTPDKRVLRDGQESGWGLWLVQELADRWGVRREDSNCVWFELRVEPATAQS